MRIIPFFSIVLVIALLVSPVLADSIVIETEDGSNYLSFRSDKSVSISGYNIQLNFSPGIEIQALEPLPPYAGAVNIQNGYAKIVGFTAETTTPERLATLSYSGTGDFEILVLELYDSDMKPVTVTNSQMVPPASPTATPTVPPYQPAPGYVSPTGTGVNTELQSISGAPTGTKPTLGAMETGTPITTAPQETALSTAGVVQTAVVSTPVTSITLGETGASTGAEKTPMSIPTILGGLVISLIIWRSGRKSF